MANEITSIASIRSLNAANNSGQATKPGVAKLPEARGRELPTRGKNLPPQVDNSVEVREAVTSINKAIQHIQRDISFNMDEESGLTIIRVIDTGSGELIRQIPSEEVLAIATHLRDFQVSPSSQGDIGQGLLFSDSS